jgi:hypothetical protein
MITDIKIYGERNSGTNFINLLLLHNFKNINVLSPYHKHYSGWKHGYPNINSFDKLKNILFIFIIRDLDAWIISMFKNPYHYKCPGTMEDFINNPLKICEPNKDHDVHINKEERKTIMDLRYAKIKSYLEMFDKIKNGIIINLENIQEDKGEKFINFLHNKFNFEKVPKFICINKHTKCKQNILNRNYNSKIPECINDKINKELELIVKELKNNYLIK